MRLLLVEDDDQLINGLSKALKRDGFSIVTAMNGCDAIIRAEYEKVDIIILDIGLPDMSGLEVLKQIKDKGLSCKIIMLSAKEELSTKVKALDAGADDYLVKPFEYEELTARIRVLERNLNFRQHPILEVGPLTVDISGHIVRCNGEDIELSKKEFMLLKALMESAGRVQTKEALEAKLYDFAEEVVSNSIEVHVHHIRKKIPHNFIHTIRGIGYTIKKL